METLRKWLSQYVFSGLWPGGAEYMAGQGVGGVERWWMVKRWFLGNAAASWDESGADILYPIQ